MKSAAPAQDISKEQLFGVIHTKALVLKKPVHKIEWVDFDDQERLLFEQFATNNKYPSGSHAYLQIKTELVEKLTPTHQSPYSDPSLPGSYPLNFGGGHAKQKRITLDDVSTAISLYDSPEQLPPEIRAFLAAYARQNNWEGSIEECFFQVKQSSRVNQNTIDRALLTQLVSEMREDTQIELSDDFPASPSLKQSISKALQINRLYIRLRNTDNIPPDHPAAAQIHAALTEAEPKNDLHTQLLETSRELIAEAIKVLPASPPTTQPITSQQADRACNTLGQLIILSSSPSDHGEPLPLDIPEVAELIELALALEIPSFDSPLARLAREIVNSTQSATPSDLTILAPLPRTPPSTPKEQPGAQNVKKKTFRFVYNPGTNTITDIVGSVEKSRYGSTPPTFTQQLQQSLSLGLDTDDVLAQVNAVRTKTHAAVTSSPVAIAAASNFDTNVISGTFTNEILAALSRSASLPNTPLPTASAIETATAIEGLINSNDPRTDIHTPEYVGVILLGTFSPETIEAWLRNPLSNPTLQQLYEQHPAEFNRVLNYTGKLFASPLAPEISPPRQTPSNRPNPQTSRTKGFVSTKLSQLKSIVESRFSRLPIFGRYSQYVFHPYQSARNWLAKKIGERIARQILVRFSVPLMRWSIGRYAVQTITKEGFRRGLGLVSSEVKKRIAQFIAAQLAKGAAKVGIQIGVQAGLGAAAEGANVVVPGLGLILHALIIVAGLGISLIKKVYNKLQGIAVSIWGEKIKARDLIALPLLALITISQTAGTILALASTGTLITAGVSLAVAGIIYISAFNLGPIIGSLAQIGPFQDPGSYIGLPPDPGSDYTYNDPTTRVQCFTFDNAIYPWPDQIKQPIVSSVNAIGSSYSNYMNRLCRYLNHETDISLQFGGHSSLGYGGYVPRMHTIVIYNNFNNFLFILSHETGHIYTQRYPSTYQSFRLDPGVNREGILPSYSYPTSQPHIEDFAETIGKYIGDSPYLNRYPEHRRFARDNIFN